MTCNGGGDGPPFRPMLQVTVGRMRLLKEDERQDVEMLQTAVLDLVYRAQDDLA